MVVNKLEGVYDAKCFLSLTIHDYFLQSITFKGGACDYLVSIKSFDITDKLVQSPKFQRVIYKKPDFQNNVQRT